MYNKFAVVSVKTFEQPKTSCFIYALICPDTNIVRYVGKTTIGFTRIRQHWYDYKATKSATSYKKICWVRKLKKQNKVFKVKYLEYCESEIQLNECEKYWISFYKQTNHLLNHTDGGEVSYRHSYTDEEKKAISEKNKIIFNKPEIKEKMRNLALGNTFRKGKKYTKQQLEYISKRNQEVSGIKIKDQHGNIYPSVQSLSKLIKCSMNTIYDRLRKNPNKPIKGLILSVVT